MNNVPSPFLIVQGYLQNPKVFDLYQFNSEKSLSLIIYMDFNWSNILLFISRQIITTI